MKKIGILLAFLLVLFVSFGNATTTSAYTAYFAVSDKLDLDILDGFDLFLTPEPSDPADVAFQVYLQSNGGAVPDDIFIPPTTTLTNWDIFATTYGMNGTSELDVNLVPELVLSVSSVTPFEMEIALNSDEVGDGIYPKPWVTEITPFFEGPDGEGTKYTATVPIPPAILLLGSGLVGLVAIRRRRS